MCGVWVVMVGLLISIDSLRESDCVEGGERGVLFDMFGLLA